MSVYTYYFLDGDGAIPTFDFAEAPDPGEALSWAARLLRLSPEGDAVEIWDGDRQLSTLTRAEALAR